MRLQLIFAAGKSKAHSPLDPRGRTFGILQFQISKNAFTAIFDSDGFKFGFQKTRAKASKRRVKQFRPSRTRSDGAISA